MKKLLFILLLTIVCIGCERKTPTYVDFKSENATYGWNYLDQTTKYRVANIDGHQYLIFKTEQSGYGINHISVVHSESCSCKNKKK